MPPPAQHTSSSLTAFACAVFRHNSTRLPTLDRIAFQPPVHPDNQGFTRDGAGEVLLGSREAPPRGKYMGESDPTPELLVQPNVMHATTIYINFSTIEDLEAFAVISEDDDEASPSQNDPVAMLNLSNRLLKLSRDEAATRQLGSVKSRQTQAISDDAAAQVQLLPEALSRFVRLHAGSTSPDSNFRQPRPKYSEYQSRTQHLLVSRDISFRSGLLESR